MSISVYFFSLIILFYSPLLWSQSWQSNLVQMDASGKLTYVSDADGNRIPDFSYAGYRNSEEEIPQIQTVLAISSISGDNTAHIQSAINTVGGLEPDANGFRGALYLEAGEYQISGTLYLNHSGVIIRGAGDGGDTLSNTVLKAVGDAPHQRTVLIAGGGTSSRWLDQVVNTKRDIVSDLVPVGSKSFEVEDAGPFQVGDNIIIYHPWSLGWIAAVDGGGTEGDADWAENEELMHFNRYIKAIQDNVITIDAPLFNHLDRSLSQSYIYKYSREGLLTNIGIENLRIDIETSGSTDENHAWNAIDLYQIEDAWVINCTMLHFGLSGIRTDTATRLTITNCQALDPNSVINGSKRYNFQLHIASQLILFKDCHATNGRHHYVSNGASSVSGCVFYNCTSSGAYTSSEGHRRWSMGLLYDNHLELDGPRSSLDRRLLGLYNRGDMGTSHGWAAVHSVCWNCNVAGGEIVIQEPPTGQNYAIGCFGRDVRGEKSGIFDFTIPFDKPEGYIEGTNNAGLEPASLFLAQLSYRLSELPGQTDPIVDSFKDGNYTFNPVWTGDMDKWLVVTNSDVSSGAGFSNTLRLNEIMAVSGTKYLSTQRTASWGPSQSWGIWVGRRSSSVSEYNQSIVWLWANESDLTSPTVDGYRIQFGDNDRDDEIVLQRVDDGTTNDMITSTGAVPNDLTDIGFLIRVTRTASSIWTLYTSILPTQTSQGAIATDIPSAANTQINQGTNTDNNYIDFENGYFGIMTVYDSNSDSRMGAEFDQFYFDNSSDASLPVKLVSFNGIGRDSEVELSWSTASEFQNIGYIIMRGAEEYSNYSELDSYKNNPRLAGAGNSSHEHLYHYIDADVINNVIYWYKLIDVDFSGAYSEHGPISVMPIERINKPKSYYLAQNYPNPFNPRTIIKYYLPRMSDVDLSIYNMLGQKVETLISERQSAGICKVELDATKYVTGIYYYYLKAGEFQDVKKMILLR